MQPIFFLKRTLCKGLSINKFISKYFKKKNTIENQMKHLKKYQDKIKRIMVIGYSCNEKSEINKQISAFDMMASMP